MNDKNETGGPWSAVVLAAVVVLVAVFIVEFGLQTLVWIEAKHWASANPWLLAVPQPLAAPPSPAGSGPASSTTPPKTALLKSYEYQFTAPWAGASKLVPGSAFMQFRFASGQVIVFFDPESQVGYPARNEIREFARLSAAR